MRPLAAFIAALAFAVPALAGTAEVRYTAMENGCPPKKIEVFNQKVGAQAEITYRVECNLPKARDEATTTASTIMIRCRYNLCSYVKPEIAEGQQ